MSAGRGDRMLAGFAPLAVSPASSGRAGPTIPADSFRADDDISCLIEAEAFRRSVLRAARATGLIQLTTAHCPGRLGLRQIIEAALIEPHSRSGNQGDAEHYLPVRSDSDDHFTIPLDAAVNPVSTRTTPASTLFPLGLPETQPPVAASRDHREEAVASARGNGAKEGAADEASAGAAGNIPLGLPEPPVAAASRDERGNGAKEGAADEASA
eukprot:Hpha_TRINITY_DN10776_c0_g1::TRINITY_DN10776_c0_g1_i1::g.43403::m.43403